MSCTKFTTALKMNISGFELNEETVSYLREKEAMGFNAPYSNFTVQQARERSLTVSKHFSGSWPFDGSIKEIRVPSDQVPGKLPHLCCRARPIRETLARVSTVKQQCYTRVQWWDSCMFCTVYKTIFTCTTLATILRRA